MNKWWLIGLATPAIVGLIWIGMRSGADGNAAARSVSKSQSTDVAGPLPVKTLANAPSAVNAAAKPAAPAPIPMISPDNVDTLAAPEPISMKSLRELMDKDPKAAIEAARKALARDPNGPDAAEQTWVIVKSLAGLGRFDDARREAEVMVAQFRGTKWAEDVERHMLTHPP